MSFFAKKHAKVQLFFETAILLQNFNINPDAI